MKIKVKNQEEFLKRAFFLAYEACGGTTGMGAFQAREGATEQDVWENVSSAGDYPVNMSCENEIYGDYVMGRMMKWGVKVENGVINAGNDDFRPDYQGFSQTYKDNKTLFDAVAKSLDCEYETMAPRKSPRKWIYEKSTKTIRQMPENYWIATMDSFDGAVDNDVNAKLICDAVNYCHYSTNHK